MHVLLLVVVMTVLSTAMCVYAVSEFHVAQNHRFGMQALYLAEAGIDQAISQLRDDYDWADGMTDQVLGEMGRFTVEVNTDGDLRVLTATGEVSSAGVQVQRTVQATVRQELPNNFYDNAIYSADKVTFKGNAYLVNGNTLSGNEDVAMTNTGHVTGDLVYDHTANPLPKLNYKQLYQLASAQGNVYDAARLAQVQKNKDHFPTSFWRVPPSDPNNLKTGTPNIVYVTTDLALNGNIGTVGGFFVVVGNVLTDPTATEDTTINGRGTIDGPMYTRGTFNVNGGGGQLNVKGGIWAGVEARLNGNTEIDYHKQYMDALRELLQADVEMVLWKEGS